MYLVETSSSTPVHLSDLGVYVSAQEPAHITQAQLKTSVVLAELRRIGTVRVSKGSPSRTVRAPPAPSVVTTKTTAFQAPGAKGVRNAPAPLQRPARAAPPVTPPAMAVASQSPRKAAVGDGSDVKASKTSRE